jgi:DNA (cytosine-5)-methyltransferase 1
MLNFIDLFSGIGGFRLILEKKGLKCAAFSEINSQAIQYYKKNYDTSSEIELGDITKIKPIDIEIDILTAGVPCQAWSIAGKNKGFDDPRGQLWFHTFNAIDVFKPKMFIFENVKGLTDPRNVSALELIQEEIKKRGYYYKIFILNSNDFGTPQERIRLFIVGTKSKRQHQLMKEPQIVQYKKTLNEFLDLKIPKTFGLNYITLTDVRNGPNTLHSWDLIKTTKREKEICLLMLQNRRKKKFGPKDGNPLSLNHFQSLDHSIQKKELEELVRKGILVSKQNKYEFKNSKISSGINNIYRIYSPHSRTFSTLTSTGMKDCLSTVCFKTREEFIKNVYNLKKYRNITSIEALQLQGFPSDFVLPEKYNQWMKLVGNSVPLHSVEEVVSILINSYKEFLISA